VAAGGFGDGAGTALDAGVGVGETIAGVGAPLGVTLAESAAADVHAPAKSTSTTSENASRQIFDMTCSD
jgi:hypothetical protein